MGFPEGFVEEVRAAASIVSVVSTYVPLKKAGRSHKGLCPFHSEKTPSFNVDDSRGFFHCFGCGAGGDVFAFVMQHDRVGFPEAVRTVATMSGVVVPESRAKNDADERIERLHRIHEAALTEFRSALTKPGGAKARTYLQERGLSAETIERFELGVTPEGWETVSRALLRAGFARNEIVASGIAKERPGQAAAIYDRFHERIIFPIRNASGRLVGFGGRSLSGQEPKYLNSPETEIYRKSEVLYGLGVAKEALRRASTAVLVEGYLDLILLQQSGIGEVVASLGTSLTPQHARLLSRYAKHVYVAYDGDSAGRAAAKRALRVLLPESLTVGVVELEDGMDPDDFVRQRGGDAFRERLAGARGFVSFLVSEAKTGGEGADSKVRLVNEVLPYVALLEDPVERAVHVGRLVEVSGLEEGVLRDALRRAAAERKPELAMVRSEGRARAEWLEAEGVLVMAFLTRGKDLVEWGGDIDPATWNGLATERLLGEIWRRWREGGELDVATLLGQLESDADRQLLGAIAMRHGEVSPAAGLSALSALTLRSLEQEFRELQRRIGTAPPAEQDALLVRKFDLSRRLNALR